MSVTNQWLAAALERIEKHEANGTPVASMKVEPCYERGKWRLTFLGRNGLPFRYDRTFNGRRYQGTCSALSVTSDEDMLTVARRIADPIHTRREKSMTEYFDKHGTHLE